MMIVMEMVVVMVQVVRVSGCLQNYETKITALAYKTYSIWIMIQMIYLSNKYVCKFLWDQ